MRGARKRSKAAAEGNDEGDAQGEDSAKLAVGTKGAAAGRGAGARRGRGRKKTKREHESTTSTAAASASSSTEESVCPFDALPDALATRCIAGASLREWKVLPACAGVSLLDDIDGPPEPDLAKLAPLRAICRRFRRLIDDPLACERLAVARATDAAAPLLASRRLASLTLKCSRLSVTSLCSLLSGPLRSTLRELDLEMDAEAVVDEGLPLSALLTLCELKGLRTLRLGTTKDTSATFRELRSVSAQASLQLCAGLRLEKLDLAGLPVTAATLQALPRLAGTLRGLVVNFIHVAGEDPRPAFEAIGQLHQLETLALGVRALTATGAGGPHGGAEGEFTADVEMGEAALRPLAALANLRALELRFPVHWLGFLAAMLRLEHAGLWCNGIEDLDFQPLQSAVSLRSLVLFSPEGTEESEDDPAIGAISNLSNLKALKLLSGSMVLGFLFGPDLNWPRLRWAELVDYTPEDFETATPSGFFEFLTARMTALEELRVANAIAPGGAAALRGPRFRRLVLVGRAAGEAGPAERARLRAELPAAAELLFDEAGGSYGWKTYPEDEELGSDDDSGSGGEGDAYAYGGFDEDDADEELEAYVDESAVGCGCICCSNSRSA